MCIVCPWRTEIPGSWSCRQFWVVPCGYWEPNLGHLEKQDMLLITEPVCYHLKIPWEHLIIKCWFFFSYLRKILSYLWYYTREKISTVELVSADMGWDACIPYKGELPRMEWKKVLLKGVYPAKANSALSPWQGLIHNLHTNYKSSECIKAGRPRT